MAFGGVLGIWLGGVLAERYGWRAAFVALGAPGILLGVARVPAARAAPAPAPVDPRHGGELVRGVGAWEPARRCGSARRSCG